MIGKVIVIIYSLIDMINRLDKFLQERQRQRVNDAITAAAKKAKEQKDQRDLESIFRGTSK